MKHVHVAFLATLFLSTVGCSESGDDDAPACGASTIHANEVNNYSFESTLTLPPVSVMPDTELTIEWAGVTKDFMGHTPVVASTINVMLFELPLSELEQKLNDDEVDSSDALTPIQAHITDAVKSAELFDFLTVSDVTLTPDQILPYFDADIYPPESHTYTAILADGSLGSAGQARMIQSFRLDPDSTNTTVHLTDASTELEYEADLESLQPTLVTPGSNAISIDWGDMMVTALGGEFLPQQILEARIAHYDETPAELEEQFLDLERIAEESYDASIADGVSVRFDAFENEAGVTFPGISAEGTWVLALFCSTCRNPAPWYLTILAPCP